MKQTLVLAGALAITAFGARASADVDDLGAYRREAHHFHTPQDLAVELRFGPYAPNVDDDLSARPYDTVFGDSTRYYGGLEFDWQVLRIPYLGTLGPGFGIGYTRSKADALIESDGSRSDQETTLSIVPMYAVAVLRADVLAEEFQVPLVPYAKLGIGHAYWWSSSGGETAEGPDGKEGKGRSWGTHAALGLMLQLDWIDIEDAKEADQTVGMNHSYIFGELYQSVLDGFGSEKSLDAGTESWVLGIAAEF
jgi:hypothetical protein